MQINQKLVIYFKLNKMWLRKQFVGKPSGAAKKQCGCISWGGSINLMFSFSDVYDPVSFMGARASEARTWAMFSMFAEDSSFEKTYELYDAM